MKIKKLVQNQYNYSLETAKKQKLLDEKDPDELACKIADFIVSEVPKPVMRRVFRALYIQVPENHKAREILLSRNASLILTKQELIQWTLAQRAAKHNDNLV